MHDYISGIQQIGVGVTDAGKGMQDYKKMFGMNVLIFDDVAEAALMTEYTGGEVHSRRAALTMNLSGGGGFEIWQYKSRTPVAPTHTPQYGDYGIFSGKIKSPNVPLAYQNYKQDSEYKISELYTSPEGEHHFWITDEYGNVFNVVGCNHWFQNNGSLTGGVAGAVIGVKDMEKSIALYKDVLGISELIYDERGTFNDVPGGDAQSYRRVLLRKPQCGKGGFGKLLGDIDIELVQALDRAPNKIFEGRYWGDLGFVHLCFDVINMDGLKTEAEKHGFSFSVDSQNSFDMESAAGRFCYIETEEGTLLELVETHKVPVMKKLGLFINLKKRNLEKPLPDWMIKLLALSKVK